MNPTKDIHRKCKCQLGLLRGNLFWMKLMNNAPENQNTSKVSEGFFLVFVLYVYSINCNNTFRLSTFFDLQILPPIILHWTRVYTAVGLII